MGLQAKSNNSFMRRLAAKFSSAITPNKTRKDALGPNAGKVIEVFDVLIKTPQRLQCFKLKAGTDLLALPEENDYYSKMEKLFKTAPIEEIEGDIPKNEEEKQQEDSLYFDSVYVLDVDKSLYDVKDPSYKQTHCIRFEIERGQTQQSFKITDIDYYLEGNRHAKADSQELFNQKEKELSK